MFHILIPASNILHHLFSITTSHRWGKLATQAPTPLHIEDICNFYNTLSLKPCSLGLVPGLHLPLPFPIFFFYCLINLATLPSKHCSTIYCSTLLVSHHITVPSIIRMVSYHIAMPSIKLMAYHCIALHCCAILPLVFCHISAPSIIPLISPNIAVPSIKLMVSFYTMVSQFITSTAVP